MNRTKVASELLKIAKELTSAKNRTAGKRLILRRDDFKSDLLWNELILDEFGISTGEGADWNETDEVELDARLV